MTDIQVDSNLVIDTLQEELNLANSRHVMAKALIRQLNQQIQMMANELADFHQAMENAKLPQEAPICPPSEVLLPEDNKE